MALRLKERNRKNGKAKGIMSPKGKSYTIKNPIPQEVVYINGKLTLIPKELKY